MIGYQLTVKDDYFFNRHSREGGELSHALAHHPESAMVGAKFMLNRLGPRLCRDDGRKITNL